MIEEVKKIQKEEEMDSKTRQKIGDRINDCVNRQSFTNKDLGEICQLFEPKPKKQKLEPPPRFGGVYRQGVRNMDNSR